MLINIIAIGKLKSSDNEAILIQKYLERIRWKHNFCIFDSKGDLTPHKEFEFFTKQIEERPDSYKIILDERGENISSSKFANLISEAQLKHNVIDFFIGGANGFNDAIRLNAHKLISFGKLTWPHKLARVMLTEQIYRAYSILNNHPYHK